MVRLPAVLLAAVLASLSGCVASEPVDDGPSSSIARSRGIRGSAHILESESGNHQKSFDLAPCLPEEAATNARTAQYFRGLANITADFIPYFEAQVSDNLTDIATFDRVDAELTARLGPTVVHRRYLCLPSANDVSAGYNEYVAATNKYTRAAVRKWDALFRNAHQALDRLTQAKDALVRAAGGPTGPLLEAKKAFEEAVEKILWYRLRDLKINFPERKETLSAANFYAARDKIVQEGRAVSIPGVKTVEELGDSISIVAKGYGTVEVRYFSYGPGACDVDTTSSLGAMKKIIAPPVIWGDWYVIESHAGTVTMTIRKYKVHCETDVRGQVRYFK